MTEKMQWIIALSRSDILTLHDVFNVSGLSSLKLTTTMRSKSVLQVTILFLANLSYCHGFFVTKHNSKAGSISTTLLRSEVDENQDLLIVKNCLKENYPALSLVLEKNDGVWKALGGAEGGGFTIFAPNAEAFEALGETKRAQLLDPRNSETSEKIGAYHVIPEVVTADQLYNSGGVITLGGEIPVDRSTSGGFFGVGGQEDGGVTINTARVVQSFELGTGIVHEVEGLVCPNIMWRYMDQLRIPGSS